MGAKQQRESGSIFVSIIIIVGVFFLFFWGVQQVLSQEWFLLRKKSAWVKKLDIAKSLIRKQNQFPIVKKENNQAGSCDLYRQKLLISERKPKGYHSLNMSNCYNDHFYKLNVDFYLDAVSSDQNISYTHYYYEANNDSRALEGAVLVELVKVDEDLVSVVIRYENQQYNYHLPLFNDGEWIRYQLIRGVDGGVMIVINRALWFLSFTGEVTLVTRDLPFNFESIQLSAFIPVEGALDNNGGRDVGYSNEVSLSKVYFLVQLTRAELRLYSIDAVGVGEEIGRWDLRGGQNFNTEYEVLEHSVSLGVDLSFDLEKIEWLSQVGMIVLFKSMNRGDGRLLAIDWQGHPLWGDQSIWVRQASNDVYCGLQQILFEPVAGWPLGCQRLRESKIVIE